MHTRWFYMDLNCLMSQSVYSVDIMQIWKRNASLVRRSIASSFNFSQAPGRRLRKERDCLQSGLKSLSSQNHTLFRTGFKPVQDRDKSNCIPSLGQRGQKTIPCPAARIRITQKRDYPPGQICKFVGVFVAVVVCRCCLSSQQSRQGNGQQIDIKGVLPWQSMAIRSAPLSHKVGAISVCVFRPQQGCVQWCLHFCISKIYISTMTQQEPHQIH